MSEETKRILNLIHKLSIRVELLAVKTTDRDLLNLVWKMALKQVREEFPDFEPEAIHNVTD